MSAGVPEPPGTPKPPDPQDCRLTLAMIAATAAAQAANDGLTFLLNMLGEAQGILEELPPLHPARVVLTEAAHRARNLACDSALLICCLKKAGAKHTHLKLRDVWERLRDAPEDPDEAA